MTRWAAPGGWTVEVVTLEATGGRREVESGRQVAGDGQSFLVRRDGFYAASPRTVEQLARLLGESFANLAPAA